MTCLKDKIGPTVRGRFVTKCPLMEVVTVRILVRNISCNIFAVRPDGPDLFLSLDLLAFKSLEMPMALDDIVHTTKWCFSHPLISVFSFWVGFASIVLVSVRMSRRQLATRGAFQRLPRRRIRVVAAKGTLHLTAPVQCDNLQPPPRTLSPAYTDRYFHSRGWRARGHNIILVTACVRRYRISGTRMRAKHSAPLPPL
jgi:hypothetical protein